jgi:hypothetical protein
MSQPTVAALCHSGQAIFSDKMTASAERDVTCCPLKSAIPAPLLRPAAPDPGISPPPLETPSAGVFALPPGDCVDDHGKCPQAGGTIESRMLPAPSSPSFPGSRNHARARAIPSASLSDRCHPAVVVRRRRRTMRSGRPARSSIAAPGSGMAETVRSTLPVPS